MANNTNNSNNANTPAPAKLTQPITAINGLENTFFNGLNWQNIPQVAVITGINGSGKTRLLNGISAQFSSTNNANFEFNGVKDNFLLSGLHAYVKAKGNLFSTSNNNNFNNLNREITDIATALSKAENQNINAFILNINSTNVNNGNYIVDKKDLHDIKDLQNIILPNKVNNIYFWDSVNPNKSVASINSANTFLLLQQYIKLLSKLPEHTGKNLVELFKLPFNNKVFAQVQLGVMGNLNISLIENLFKSHQQDCIEKVIEKYTAELQKSKNISNSIENIQLPTNLLDESNSPWTIINKHFNEQCKLNNPSNNSQSAFKYTVNAPSKHPTEANNYKLSFTNNEKNETISYQQLSTGEQVIVQLVCMFYALSSFSNKNIGSLLLLDEFDANLNPQLSKMYMQLINSLAKDFNVQVILTTHSPITVVNATPDSIFWMENGKIDKEYIKDSEGKEQYKNRVIAELTPDMLVVNDLQLKSLLNAISCLEQGKHICFTEGKSDEIYLNAIKKQLENDNEYIALQNINFINMGGCSHCKRCLEITNEYKIKNNNQSLIIALLDDDEPARQYYKAQLCNRELQLNNQVIFLQPATKHEIYTKKFKKDGLNYCIEHLVIDEFIDSNSGKLTNKWGNEGLEVNKSLLDKLKGTDEEKDKAKKEIENTIFSYKVDPIDKIDKAKNIVKQEDFYKNYINNFKPTFDAIIQKLTEQNNKQANNKKQKNTP